MHGLKLRFFLVVVGKTKKPNHRVSWAFCYHPSVFVSNQPFNIFDPFR